MYEYAWSMHIKQPLIGEVEKSDWKDGTRACRITEEVQGLGEKVSIERFFRSCFSKEEGRVISTFFRQFSTETLMVQMPGGRRFRLPDRNSAAFVHMFSTDVFTRFPQF